MFSVYKMLTLLIKSHKWKLELSFPVKSERLSIKQLKGNNTVYHEKNNCRTYYLCEVSYAENM